MNAASLEPVRWSPRRWFYAITVCFVAQAGLVMFLGKQQRDPPRLAPASTTIHLAVDPSATRHISALPLVSDPTLFALPNLQGFSGGAWLKCVPLEYRFSDWTEPPRWLALNTEELGATFSLFVSTNIAPPLLIADKPTSRLIGSDLFFTNPPVASSSQVAFDGELARLSLLSPLQLKSWRHTDLLTNTVVQLLVNADGEPVSATLVDGCGLAEADHFGLALATSAQFRPRSQGKTASDSAGDFTWGKMIFRWHTLPLAATNALPVLP